MRVALIASIALLVATAGITGETSPESLTKYRHVYMEGMAKHMKAAGMIVKGEVDRPEDLLFHAQALHGASGEITNLFPPETAPDKVKSDAKPEIWTNWDGFVAASKTFETETAKLVEVAKTKDLDAFKAQFGKVGKSCGGCHDDFQVEDDH